ncbi:MAG: methyltransferase domain-containing protein [Alphaproteobacteria bacterium]|nr:MAG: methyltransferase domain-containing protein [Alphaproteobacteria bacterium]
MTSNADIVVDQFTRQAAPFANSSAMRDEDALRLLVEFSGASAEDTVLDVACGPGLVVAAFAKVCRHATGIDLTPAMIDRAREHAGALGLNNVDWRVGNVLPLPFPDGAFSVVASRFAFHHFPDPLAVLREMARVCTRPGRVVVADIAASNDATRADALNRMERLRDPSHTKALTMAEMRVLFAQAGLSTPRETCYDVHADLEGLMAASFPAPADAPIIRTMFEDSLADDGLGMKTRRKDDRILLSYPIAIYAADV